MVSQSYCVDSNHRSGSGIGRGVLMCLLPTIPAKPNNRYCVLCPLGHHHPQGGYKGIDKERRKGVMDWGKWWHNKVARLLFLLLSCAFISCNKEDVILEPTPMSVTLTPQTHKVNIVVDNQAKGVIFESDSIVLHYQDRETCKSFDTEAYYIKEVMLHGNLYTPYYTIYSGDIRIPILQYIPDSINYIDVVLYDGCPWYSLDGNKVLQSIQFSNPDVEEWEEGCIIER